MKHITEISRFKWWEKVVGAKRFSDESKVENNKSTKKKKNYEKSGK